MEVQDVPELVRSKAMLSGAEAWLAGLPLLVADLERDWSISVGRPYKDGSEAFVAEATLEDGTEAVLKLLVPPGAGAGRHEIAALRLANGDGCVRLLRDDASRDAMLLERLGVSLHDLDLPVLQRHEILCAAAIRLWRPAAGCGLSTGAEKARWLVEYIQGTWEELGRPCSEQAVEYALACAARREAAHDDERAVLVHGDVHEWNALRELGGRGGFKLVDPDGLLAEAEYDMGTLMRGDPLELVQGDPFDRAHWLAKRTGLDATAIWEWGVVERVSSGLFSVSIDLQPFARQLLEAADRVAVGRA
jgi:streptomycin 6-kinase